MRAQKLLLRAVVGALCVTAAIAVVVLLSGRFDGTSWRILASTSAVSFFGLLAAPAGASFVLTFFLIWSDWSNALGSYYRVLGAVAIVDVLLIAVVAVLRRGGGPITQTHRVRIDGRLVEIPGRDWAAAVASAIRQAEREGAPARRIERA